MKTVFDPVKLEKELRALERERSLTETRTSLFNLVLIEGREDHNEAEELYLAHLLGKRAARVIHINLDSPGPTRVSVSARCAPDKENKGVCFQEILIDDGEDRAGTAPGSWSAFLIRDIPVNVLWRSCLSRKDVLAFIREQADKFIIDGDFIVSRLCMPIPEYLNLVRTDLMDHGVQVADFAWRRFQPLRTFTALAFENEEPSRLLPGLRGLEISGGGPASRDLYLRWVASVLDWKLVGDTFVAPKGLEIRPVSSESRNAGIRVRFDFGSEVLELEVDSNGYGTARFSGREIFSKVLAFPTEGDLLLQEVDMPGIDGLFVNVAKTFRTSGS